MFTLKFDILSLDSFFFCIKFLLKGIRESRKKYYKPFFSCSGLVPPAGKEEPEGVTITSFQLRRQFCVQNDQSSKFRDNSGSFYFLHRAYLGWWAPKLCVPNTLSLFGFTPQCQRAEHYNQDLWESEHTFFQKSLWHWGLIEKVFQRKGEFSQHSHCFFIRKVFFWKSKENWKLTIRK